MNKRRFSFFLLLLTAATMAFAQQADTTWSHIDKLIDNGKYTTAYTEAEKAFGEVNARGDSRGSLMAVYLMNRAAAGYQEEWADSALARYLRLLPALSPIDRAVCHLQLATLYRQLEENLGFGNPSNRPTDEPDLDYKYWDRKRMNDTIFAHLKAALADPALLQGVPAEELAPLLMPSGNEGVNLTPTLFDVAVRTLCETAQVESRLTEADVQLTALMAPEEEFQKLAVADDGNREKEVARYMVRMLQQLEAFHRNRCRTALRGMGMKEADDEMIRLVVNRLEQIERIHGTPLERLGEAAWKPLLERYGHSPSEQAAELYWKAASIPEARDMELSLSYLDTVLVRWPQSPAASKCLNMKRYFFSQSISIQMFDELTAEATQPVLVKTRNVERLYVRVVKEVPEKNLWDRKRISSMKALREWEQEVPPCAFYQYQDSWLFIPPLPTGSYTLLVSPSAAFDTAGFEMVPFKTYSLDILNAENEAEGFVVDRTSGAPRAGVKVSLVARKYSGTMKTVASCTTDSLGHFDLRKEYAQLSYDYYYETLEVDDDGRILKHPVNGSRETPGSDLNMWQYMDRPLYKPGDTVHFAVVVTQTEPDGTRGCKEGFTLNLQIKTPNYKKVDSLTLVTDSFGTAHGTYVLPTDALPGEWSIWVRGEKLNGHLPVPVEAYKQPKFAVQLHAAHEEHRFGKELHLEGMAASYSSMPVGGAEVRYTVYRKRFYHYYFSAGEPTTVASRCRNSLADGVLTTEKDGSFTIAFTPQPDPSDQSGERRCYVYVVQVTVTDLNGESHEASTTVHVGEISGRLACSVSGDSGEEMLSVELRDLDGLPLAGSAQLTVERLRLPKRALLPLEATVSQNEKESKYSIHMPLSRSEFERLMPELDYDGSVSHPERWATEVTAVSKRVKFSDTAAFRMPLGDLPSGVYRVTVSAVGEMGDTMRSEQIVRMTHDDRAVDNSLFCYRMDRSRAEVGDTVRLWIGSRHKEVHAYVKLKAGKQYERNLHFLLDGKGRELLIPVGDSLLGGFNILIMSKRANVTESRVEYVEVPYTHKRLEVRWTSFRDRLQPGSQERWTLSIRNARTGAPSSAAMIMTLYDKALDSYRYHLRGYNYFPWYSNYRMGTLSQSEAVQSNLLTQAALDRLLPMPEKPFTYSPTYQWKVRMLPVIYGVVNGVEIFSMKASGTARGEDGMVTMQGSVRKRAGVIVTEEEEVEEVEEVVFSWVEEDEAEERETVGDQPADAHPLRSNLSTLALFAPTLRSDTDGGIEVAFTVPDLLTTWTLRGEAWSRELEVGDISAEVVTHKLLMVVPNVPRFLRQGDSCRFAVKVSNASNERQSACVELSFRDALSGDTLRLLTDGGIRRVEVEPMSSVVVEFPMAVPEGDCYMALYTVMASSEEFSDGEQALLPLLSNRQLVTESMAMHLNGKGERQYLLEHLAALDTGAADYTLQQRQLLVELTPNPVWLVLQALPYVREHSNPTNIYLANACYTNALAAQIERENPLLDTLFHEWEQEEPDAFRSALQRNNDISQMVAESTPWLCEALDEEQQHHDIAQFFDRDALQRQLERDLQRLADAQRGDGGWSWIEGGRYSSLYITQYILRTFGLLRQQGVELSGKTTRMLQKGMDYVDRETYDFYRRYIKEKQWEWEVVNLDYLYLRSLYPDNRLSKQQQEAYDYFYSNAKKHYKDYTGLYSQALLALVFHRHDDHALADRMVDRLGERALVSDEAGMYWRDNSGGYRWHERPIETQALLIRCFAEVTGDYDKVALMQQWLLQQKQTTRWNSDVASVSAIQAMLMQPAEGAGNKALRMQPSAITLSFGSHTLATDTTRHALHVSQRIEGDEIRPEDGRVTIRKEDDGIAWGALYWQYLERVDKIPYSSTGVTLKPTLYRVGDGGVLQRVQEGLELKVGDRVRMRMEIRVDRNLEYVTLDLPRNAALEPLSTESGWHWNRGLSYYLAVNNTGSTFYIDQLDKGQYVVEYEFFVNNGGRYLSAPAVLQCLYAPEFRSTCPMPDIIVK